MPYEPIRSEHLNQMLSKLREATYEPVGKLKVTAWVTPEPVSFEERMSGKKSRFRMVSDGASYGIVPGFALLVTFHNLVLTQRLFFCWT